MIINKSFNDYELIDAALGERLERWGGVTVIRPDPQAVWRGEKDGAWKTADAKYHRSEKGGGHWEFYSGIPKSWRISEDGLTFKVKPMNFKHLGLFPEQRANWSFAADIIRGRKEFSVLNLFAYTGGATAACLAAGASVCHVDAAKGMVEHAKENIELSGLGDRPVRYIVDDCKKFVMREIRREHRYDGIILDPPSYGRGPSGEIWKIEDELFDFLELCAKLLDKNSAFMMLNSYTTGLSAGTLANIVSLTVKAKLGGTVFADEIGIHITKKDLPMPCGYTVRWLL